jgi:myo-inositol-1(or 4)-monophosphatase
VQLSPDLERIRDCLERAGEILRRIAAEDFAVERKEGGDPVTEADLAVDRLLRERLPQPGDGWLSEETADDPARLGCSRVWIVDPLDGTKEFVQRIPEWSVSIGLVEDGRPIAGGILNPATQQMVLGGIGSGVFLNGQPAQVADLPTLKGARVLASRSEVKRGEWERFGGAEFEVVPTGSVAYKMSLVAAGLYEATWTLVPKSEWDVAAGVALVLAAGGEVVTTDGVAPTFNRKTPLLPGLIASGPSLMAELRRQLL